MKNENGSSTDAVFCKYEKLKAKITVRKLDEDFILLEGNRIGLQFLADVIFACARGKHHSAQFSPLGGGSNRFTEQSTLGIYVHRLPCPDTPSQTDSPRQGKGRAGAKGEKRGIRGRGIRGRLAQSNALRTSQSMRVDANVAGLHPAPAGL
jgi:hypothetical protein